MTAPSRLELLRSCSTTSVRRRSSHSMMEQSRNHRPARTPWTISTAAAAKSASVHPLIRSKCPGRWAATYGDPPKTSPATSAAPLSPCHAPGQRPPTKATEEQREKNHPILRLAPTELRAPARAAPVGILRVPHTLVVEWVQQELYADELSQIKKVAFQGFQALRRIGLATARSIGKTREEPPQNGREPPLVSVVRPAPVVD
jgi:hypothetical protein